MHIQTLLSASLKQLDNEEASIDAQALLQHVLNVNRAWLIAHADDEISEQDYNTFQVLLARRIAGEPIAYILGEREFYGLQLKVTPDTLIPRPDTETLVEMALAKLSTLSLRDWAPKDSSFPRRRESSPLSPEQPCLDSRLRGNDGVRVLDLGTGTGAIALAIAKHRPHAQVTAVDCSNGALKVAQKNASNLNITNVCFMQSNWLDALDKQTFDIIVSNPPYIEDDDPHLSQGDLRFEPRTALASGSDGLNDIRHIISQATNYLHADGWLLFEHGYNQTAAVAELLAAAGFSDIETIQDFGGNDRVTLGQLK